MKYPAVAKVSYFDEFINEMENKQVFMYVDGARDAVDQICDWFGEKNIDSFSIEMFEDGLIEVNDDFVKMLKGRV